MTEQEFRELTAYQPPSPSPKAHGPTVASVAAAVAAVKTPANNAAQEQPSPEQITHVPAAPVPAVPPPPPQIVEPTQMQVEGQIQTTAQTIAQAQGRVYSPQQAESSLSQNPIQTAQAESVPRAPQNGSFEMVPQQKHAELMKQYTRLTERFKSLAEERDSLSRQVSELKRVLAEQEKNGTLQGRDYKEEIRLLGKLIDAEQSLRSADAKQGDYLYERHDKLLNVFLNIVARTE
jgi:hypothetical protein